MLAKKTLIIIINVVRKDMMDVKLARYRKHECKIRLSGEIELTKLFPDRWDKASTSI